MNREDIYSQLRERIPYLQRRMCTPRVLEESGIDVLLDRLLEIQYLESFELLQGEEGSYKL